jgi:hypothetical protein
MIISTQRYKIFYNKTIKMEKTVFNVANYNAGIVLAGDVKKLSG